MLTIYTKDWCGYCNMAKNYFTDNNIDYEEINIDNDSSALNFMKSEEHKTVPVWRIFSIKKSGKMGNS